MIRKEALNRIFDLIIETKAIPALESQGFKYIKSKRLCERAMADYTQNISFYSPHSPMVFDEEKEELYYYFSVSVSLGNKKYDKWCLEQFHQKNSFMHVVATSHCYAQVDMALFNKEDFFEPSKAQRFKNLVTNLLKGGHSLQQERFEWGTFVHSQLPSLLTKANELSDYHHLFESRPHPLQTSYVNLLIFYKDIEKAKTVYQENFDTLLKAFEQLSIENNNDTGKYLDQIKYYKEVAARFLQLDFQIPEVQRAELLQTNKSLQIVDMRFEERYTLQKPFRKMISFAINTNNGDVIIGHEKNTVTIWGKTGKLKKEIVLTYPKGFVDLSEYEVGYLSDIGFFYANNYLIDENFETFELKLPVETAKGQKYPPNPKLRIPLAYSKELDLFVLHYHWNKINEIIFYDRTYSIVKKIPVTLQPMEIVARKKWILVYEYLKHITILDFDGNTIAVLESNNASLGFGDHNHHAVSPGGNYIYSFFYYVKSNLFSSPNFKRDVLWGHTTYEKDYKELYYNDVNHNFGVSPAKFSPDEEYLVAGADHGKYVAWKLPSKERIELIPNVEYLKKLPDAQVYSIGEKKYLKNRGHEIKDIQFYKNGDYFSLLINQDILIWDREFNHLATIEAIGKLTPCGEQYLLQIGATSFTLLEKV